MVEGTGGSEEIPSTFYLSFGDTTLAMASPRPGVWQSRDNRYTFHRNGLLDIATIGKATPSQWSTAPFEVVYQTPSGEITLTL
jgi:hypothetical protein